MGRVAPAAGVPKARSWSSGDMAAKSACTVKSLATVLTAPSPLLLLLLLVVYNCGCAPRPACTLLRCSTSSACVCVR